MPTLNDGLDTCRRQVQEIPEQWRVMLWQSAVQAGSSRFTDVQFSRIWDKFGNDVTYERNAPGGNTIWGVRVYPPYNDGTVLIKQTVRRGREFVIDDDGNGRHRERHVNCGDDAALVQAIRDALQGQLGRGR